MADFLSSDWLAELDAVLRTLDPSAFGPLVIEQVVKGVPGVGERRYRIGVAEGRVRALDGSAALAGAALVRFTTDYRTAVAIARGRENAQHALGAGRLQLGGQISVLIAHADQLARIADVTATLREVTSYPDAGAGYPDAGPDDADRAVPSAE